MEYNRYINDLRWDLPLEIQEKAIEKLVSIPDEYIGFLLQPLGKGYWENAAIIIKKIGFPRYKQYIPKLLEWLQDINWPGALDIVESLSSINYDELKPYVEQATTLAWHNKDETWLFGLKILVRKASWLKPELWSDEVYKALMITEE